MLVQVCPGVLLLLLLLAPPTGSRYLPASGRFWHITDLHLDPSYHLTSDPTKVCFSSKGAPATHAGLFGDFLCDSPYRLIQSAFAHMAPLTQPQDFIIWTGDSPPHVPVDELSTDTVIQVISNMTQTIRHNFPNLTVYPALGNHDYWPQVYIIAHVPVGYLPFARNTTAVREHHNERLVAIFRQYSDVIAGHFYGHTHRDSVMVLLDKQGKPLNSLFVSPAVTPIKHVLEPYSNNPAFRTYLYNTEDYTVMDIWQYYLNLTEANEKQRSDWRLEYVMTEAFGLADLRPQSLLQLGLSFRLPQTKTFQLYFSHYMVGYNASITCEGACKLSQVCAVLYLDRPSYNACVTKGEW
ncbi:acid sphingomyelinase-like phosphodiesterase 3a isoform X4 [Sebastes umbrosus]|uniref:acid sphingomyelinase-like phosphodiesterase 3a isoform X4 n=1 Tax=Sebastes umbrosus TaxID=72105 RepID=UPI0018A050DA|nr:acid sphingomyelinase-like phosphodiesterase 3a isoform X4 [Sebastes umbrosus]